MRRKGGKPKQEQAGPKPAKGSAAFAPRSASCSPSTEPELQLLHRWLDTCGGIGLIAVGMHRQGLRFGAAHQRSNRSPVFRRALKHGVCDTLAISGQNLAEDDERRAENPEIDCLLDVVSGLQFVRLLVVLAMGPQSCGAQFGKPGGF